MKRGKVIAIGMFALALIVGAWFWGSPHLALSELKDAAESGERHRLNNHLDAEALRESIGRQARLELDESIFRPEMNLMAQVQARNMLAGPIDMLADQRVAIVFEPIAMEHLLTFGESFAEHSVRGTHRDELVSWSLERSGFDTFVATTNSPTGRGPVHLIFQRDGIGWVLVDIENIEL